MEKEFVTYEQALALKELGFDERCLIKSEHTKKCIEKEKPGGCQLHNLHCGYPDCTIDKTITPIPLPLKQQVFRWFDKKYNLFGYIEKFQCGRYEDVISANFMEEYEDEILFDTIEEAENNCINRLIELAKQQDNGK